MSVELKPCPFCGKEPRTYSSLAAGNCAVCCGGPVGLTFDEWNRRPLEDALKEKCERYEAAFKKISDIRNGPHIDGPLGKCTDMWRVAWGALATPIGRDGGKAV